MTNQKDKAYLTVNIYSPEGQVYTHKAYGCRVKTVNGYLTILPNHIPIVTALDISPVIVTRKNKDRTDYIAIDSGVLTFKNNELDIAATYAIRARDIDQASVEIEKNNAEADMQEAKVQDDAAAKRRANIRLRRAINQIDVSQSRN